MKYINLGIFLAAALVTFQWTKSKKIEADEKIKANLTMKAMNVVKASPTKFKDNRAKPTSKKSMDSNANAQQMDALIEELRQKAVILDGPVNDWMDGIIREPKPAHEMADAKRRAIEDSYQTYNQIQQAMGNPNLDDLSRSALLQLTSELKVSLAKKVEVFRGEILRSASMQETNYNAAIALDLFMHTTKDSKEIRRLMRGYLAVAGSDNATADLMLTRYATVDTKDSDALRAEWQKPQAVDKAVMIFDQMTNDGANKMKRFTDEAF